MWWGHWPDGHGGPLRKKQSHGPPASHGGATSPGLQPGPRSAGSSGLCLLSTPWQLVRLLPSPLVLARWTRFRSDLKSFFRFEFIPARAPCSLRPAGGHLPRSHGGAPVSQRSLRAGRAPRGAAGGNPEGGWSSRVGGQEVCGLQSPPVVRGGTPTRGSSEEVKDPVGRKGPVQSGK